MICLSNTTMIQGWSVRNAEFTGTITKIIDRLHTIDGTRAFVLRGFDENEILVIYVTTI